MSDAVDTAKLRAEAQRLRRLGPLHDDAADGWLDVAEEIERLRAELGREREAVTIERIDEMLDSIFRDRMLRQGSMAEWRSRVRVLVADGAARLSAHLAAENRALAAKLAEVTEAAQRVLAYLEAPIPNNVVEYNDRLHDARKVVAALADGAPKVL